MERANGLFRDYIDRIETGVYEADDQAWPIYERIAHNYAKFRSSFKMLCGTLRCSTSAPLPPTSHMRTHRPRCTTPGSFALASATIMVPH